MTGRIGSAVERRMKARRLLRNPCGVLANCGDSNAALYDPESEFASFFIECSAIVPPECFNLRRADCNLPMTDS